MSQTTPKAQVSETWLGLFWHVNRMIPTLDPPCTTIVQRAHQKDPDRDPRVE